MSQPGIIERAFELARCSTTVEEVRKSLKSEGYFQVDAHLAGPSIKAELKKVLGARLGSPLPLDRSMTATSAVAAPAHRRG
jgi:hypothetical protein